MGPLGRGTPRHFCVAGVVVGDFHLHFARQAWRLVTSTFVLHGKHCTYDTYGTGLALVACRAKHCHTPSVSHNFVVTHPLSHTTLSHTIFTHIFVTHHLSHTIFVTPLCHTHTHLCHTPSLTPNFVTHNLSGATLSHTHTTLSHTIFHAQLCRTQRCQLAHTHTPSFTHNIVRHTTLSHSTLSLPTLSHPIFQAQLCHTRLCHTTLSHIQFVTHAQHCHTMSHIQLFTHTQFLND